MYHEFVFNNRLLRNDEKFSNSDFTDTVPKLGVKKPSVGIVSTKFLTDLTIARSFSKDR